MTGEVKDNVLVRLPSLPEDEGLYRPMYQFNNFDDLSNWLEKSRLLDYFIESDFVYIGTGGPGNNKYGIKSL